MNIAIGKSTRARSASRLLQSRAFAIFLLAVALGDARTASAQFINWDSGGFTSSWHNTANWDVSPARLPGEGETARIGNLAAAAGESVTLDGNGIVENLEISAGVDLDTNGHSLTITDALDVNPGTTMSELTLRPATAPTALDYSLRAHEISLNSSNGQLRMLGGHLLLSGNFFSPASLTIGPTCDLVGYGTISTGAAAGIFNDGLITVREPLPVVGEPAARTLEFNLTGLVSNSTNLGAIDIGRNSTLRFTTQVDSPAIDAEQITIRGNSTLDIGLRTRPLKTGGNLIVNSGPVQIGLATLPAVPAVIDGMQQFILDNAGIALDQSDEALNFDVYFRHLSGSVTNHGTVRFNSGADLSATADYVTAGFGQLVNAAPSHLNLANGADIDSPIVNHGELTISGGSLGHATVDALTLGNTASLEVGLEGVIPGQFDALTVEGNAVLGGELQVALAPAFSALPGNEFPILTSTFGIVSGTFDTTILPVFNGRTFEVLYPNSQSVVLRVIEALPGDYNRNGVVDGPDYVVWRNGLGTTYSQTDYDVWRAHFGEVAGAGSMAEMSAQSAIPEPSCSILSFCSALLISAGRVGRGMLTRRLS